MRMWVRKCIAKAEEDTVEFSGRKRFVDLSRHSPHGFRATCIFTPMPTCISCIGLRWKMVDTQYTTNSSRAFRSVILESVYVIQLISLQELSDNSSAHITPRRIYPMKLLKCSAFRQILGQDFVYVHPLSSHSLSSRSSIHKIYVGKLRNGVTTQAARKCENCESSWLCALIHRTQRQPLLPQRCISAPTFL